MRIPLIDDPNEGLGGGPAGSRPATLLDNIAEDYLTDLRIPLVAAWRPARGRSGPSASCTGTTFAGGRAMASDPDGILAILSAELRRLPISLKDWARQQPLDDLIDHAPVFYAVHLWNLYEESLGRAAA